MKKAVSLLLTLMLTLSLCTPVLADPGDEGEENMPQQGQQEKSDAYTMAMTLLKAGQMPNEDTLAAAGINSFA